MTIDHERVPLRGNRRWCSIHAGLPVIATGVLYGACLFLGLALYFKCECNSRGDGPCRPSVSDVEHPGVGDDLYGDAITTCTPGVEIFRRAIILTAVFARVIASQLVLPGTFSSLVCHRSEEAARNLLGGDCCCCPPGSPTPPIQWMFFTVLTICNILDVLQVLIPNDDRELEVWWIHVLCAQLSVFFIMSTAFMFLVYAGRDREVSVAATRFGWTFLVMIFILSAFLCAFLHKGLAWLAWWFAEWALVACFALLSICIGAAVPKGVQAYMGPPENVCCCCVRVGRSNEKDQEDN